ncbi:MAG: thiazole synthase [bacterium]
MTRKEDCLEIAGEKFNSRLLIGTGGHTNLEKLRRSLLAGESEIVTVGIRRINVGGGAGLMDLLEELDLKLLPNTAGCYTAADAVLTAELGREALDTNWVKLEVIGDDQTLYPDTTELVKAAAELVEKGFVVLPYTSDDPITAKKLVEAGCAAVMPLAAPIGSGRGISNPNNLKIIRETVDIPMIVDAGIGSASDAALAMELGADGVLLSSAISGAEHPVLMAEAMKLAVQAGRKSYRAGRIPKKLYAKPTTTMQGRIRR